MARRKGSTFKDIMDLTTMMPWWVGVVLAIISFFILHYIAVIPMETSTAQGTMVKTILRGIAGILRYILPIIFLLGSINSVIQKQKKASLYGRIKKNPRLLTFNNMTWQEFELLAGKYFEEKGYTIRQLAQPGPDGGVDLIAIRDGEKYLVQCKQWRSTSVGVKVVRELLGVISASGAVGGFVVASGEFTSSAKEFVQGRNIELIDGVEIVNFVGAETTSQPLPSSKVKQPDNKIPPCPKCGKQMIKRIAKKGANVGSQFWGCSSFPRCKGIVNINEL
jgi:restriction system protein